MKSTVRRRTNGNKEAPLPAKKALKIASCRIFVVWAGNP